MSAPAPQPLIPWNRQVETNPVPGQTQGTPLRPSVNPAGPVGLGPVSLSEAAPLSERGKAQGPGPRSLAARRTDPTGVPTQLGRSREILYLNSQPHQPRDPTTDHVIPPPALASRTRSIYPLATLPLSSSLPGLSWAVRPATPRPHLKGQRYL